MEDLSEKGVVSQSSDSSQMNQKSGDVDGWFVSALGAFAKFMLAILLLPIGVFALFLGWHGVIVFVLCWGTFLITLKSPPGSAVSVLILVFLVLLMFMSYLGSHSMMLR